MGSMKNHEEIEAKAKKIESILADVSGGASIIDTVLAGGGILAVVQVLLQGFLQGVKLPNCR